MKRQLIKIIFFGSVWGLIEATLGGFLHIWRLPFTGTIMASIGFAVLYNGLNCGLLPRHLALVATLAATFKFMGSWLFGLPIFHITIINPAVAIASQGIAFSLIFRMVELKRMRLVSQFLMASAISVVMFNAVSVWVFGWQTMHTENIWGTVLKQIPLMTIGAAFLSRVSVAIVGRFTFTIPLAWQATLSCVFIMGMTLASLFYHK